jgi:hypothetical protein
MARDEQSQEVGTKKQLALSMEWVFVAIGEFVEIQSASVALRYVAEDRRRPNQGVDAAL